MKGQSAIDWGDAKGIPWERDLLQLFVRNQLRVFAAMPVLAAIFAAVSLVWATPLMAAAWFLSTLACQYLQYHLCRGYQGDKDPGHYMEWIGMLAASEFLIGACWSLPLFVFWPHTNGIEHVFLIAATMAVIAVRIMIAANFLPVIIAGTGFMTFNVAIRCLLEGTPLYVGLGAMAIALEVFFIQLAQRLQETARDMLIFKAEKERLIGELIKSREAAEAARQRAEEASTAKSQFLATMSHELRTPLNAIMGFSEILSRELFGKLGVESYKTYAHDIHASGHHLLALVNDVLDIAKIEAGRRDLRDEPFAAAELFAELRNILDIKAKARNQTLAASTPAGLPKLMADRRAIMQILLNLTGNAIKFSPPGSRIALQAVLEEDGRLTLAVEDNGPGIPAAELKELTYAFTRGSLARAKAIDGAGLGLSIVKGLAELHGAGVNITSEPGAGTRVAVTFPIQRVLSGPRGNIIAQASLAEGQRKLIQLTG